ncbi:MAG: hypothetical protein ACOXZ4_05060 [Sphaerochaetaceae bacterium]
MPTEYYGRKSHKEGRYDWIVAINDLGCFITDPMEDWQKDNDYREEAQSNPALYEKLEFTRAQQLLRSWKRELL